jgi:type VI secretion system protein ImpA
MTPDLDTLMAPFANGDTGPDLAYDPQRHEIEQAFEVSVSIDASGTVDEGGEADWRAIIAAINEQASRTKDIWLAVYLARAGARAGRREVVLLGLDYLAGLVERYWPTVHPQLEEYGFQGRKGACDTLASFREFVGPLQRMTLLSHPRHGRFSGADLQRFHRKGETEEGYGPFRAALADGGEAELAGIAPWADAVEAAVQRCDAVLVAQAGSEIGTNFTPVYEQLAAIRAAIDAFAPKAATPPEDVEAETQNEAPARAVAAGTAGTVRNRDDVARMLDLVIDYYRQHEPGSPVPLLLARARAWVGLSFMDVLGDIAPAALLDARLLLELREPS